MCESLVLVAIFSVFSACCTLKESFCDFSKTLMSKSRTSTGQRAGQHETILITELDAAEARWRGGHQSHLIREVGSFQEQIVTGAWDQMIVTIIMQSVLCVLNYPPSDETREGSHVLLISINGDTWSHKHDCTNTCILHTAINYLFVKTNIFYPNS